MFKKKKSILKIIVMSYLLLCLGSLLTAAPSFTDLSSSHWAYESVMYLAERGIISGLPDGSFSGNDSMTRYQTSVAMKRLVDYLQGNPSAGTSQVSDARIEELEQLMRNTLRAVEAAGRDYREIKVKLESSTVSGQTTGSPTVSYEYEIGELEGDLTALDKKVDKNSVSIVENKTEMEAVRSEIEELKFDAMTEQKNSKKRFEEMSSQINVLTWTAIGGVVVGIAGVVMASFALGK